MSAPWSYRFKQLTIYVAQMVAIALLVVLAQRLAGLSDDGADFFFLTGVIGLILGELIELKWRARDR